MCDYVEHSLRENQMARLDRHLEQALLETMLVIGAMNHSMEMKSEEAAVQAHAIKKLLQFARESLESVMDLRSLSRGNLSVLAARDNHRRADADHIGRPSDFLGRGTRAAPGASDVQWSHSWVSPYW